jgi:Dyp-type peroxidase family
MAEQAVNLAEVQGLVYSGYKNHPFAGYLFAQLGDDARRSRAWVGGVRVTSAERGIAREPGRIQLAVSATGLEALGVPDEVLAALPQEVKLGMAARSRVLGDAPSTWTLGGPGERLDVLVMVFAHDEDSRRTMLDAQRAALEAAGARVRPDELTWRGGDREHFGFADGMSQPFVPGAHDRPRPGQQAVALGEILLGHRNAYGELPRGPKWDDFELGKNCTYLVFRKLEQDVTGFWRWLAQRAGELGCDPALLGAKLMGRWPGGASLVQSPERDDEAFATAHRVNDFGYLAHDPDGVRCPIASHVRRANPRDARGGSAHDSTQLVERHRIVRRGRSFGPPLHYHDALAGRDDGHPRGLYFLSLQASIARGFEFIQQTWLANPGFRGLFGEPDPIIGPGGGHFTIPAMPLRVRLADLPRVVTTRGGGYFMLPSIPALARIAAEP